MFNQPPDQNQESQDSSPFFSMDQPVFTSEEPLDNEPMGKKLLGLTPVQRFVNALLVFVLTCVLGSLCLLLTGKIVLPM